MDIIITYTLDFYYITGLNIKVFEPLVHRASASSVSLARMQNLLARNISDIQVIIYKMTHQKFR